MKRNRFPLGWDDEHVRRVLAHYETQTDEEAASEDEAAFKGKGRTVVEVPIELVPIIRQLIGSAPRTRGSSADEKKPVAKARLASKAKGKTRR
ncbi:MAG: hypothetical protein ACRDGG_12190 [Anaerolineae bacterium]